MNERRKRISEFLVTQNKYISTDFLSNIFEVSVRTIKNDLNEIDPILNSQGYKLITKRGVGVKVIKSFEVRDTDHSVVYQCNNDLYDLIIFLLNNERTTLDILSNTFLVSKTSIKNNLEKLSNSLFKDFDIDIEYSNKGIQINGAEYNKQQVIVEIDRKKSDYFIDYDGKIQYFINHYGFIAEGVIKILYEYSIELESSESVEQYIHILSTLIILIKRANEGFIDQIDNKISIDTNSLSYKIVNDINVLFKLNLGDSEIKYISDVLISNKYESISIEATKETKEIFGKFIKEIENSLSTSLKDNCNLMSMLTIHFDYMMHRIKNKIVVKNPIINDVYNNYRYIYDLVWLIIDPLLKEKGYRPNYEEIGWLTIYIQAHSINQVEGNNILIIHKGSKSTGLLAKQQVKDILPLNDKVDLLDIGSNFKDIIHKYDLVISMIHYEELYKHNNVVYVSPLLKEEDIKDILNYYLYIVSGNKVYKSLERNHIEHFFKLVKKDNLLIMNENNKADLLKKICDIAVESGNVDEKFYESVIKREDIASTYMSNGFAVPHGSYEYVNDLSIYLIKNNKAILWDNEKVEFVILICVDKDNLSIAKDLFKKAYHLINNKKLTLRLFKKYRK